jgi:putative tricarboxylic transport membrane protein
MGRFALYSNLFWLLFSLITCGESSRLKIGTIQQPGPGFFPFGAGLLMLILSVAALFQLVKKKNDGEKKTHQQSFRWWNIVIILGAISSYAFFLEKIGFLISSFLFICLLLKVVEPQPWRTAILGGLITAVASNLVFNVIFRAQIPSGIFGF